MLNLQKVLRLEAFVGIYSLLMKWICDAYVLWPFDKSFIFELLTPVNTRNYTVKEKFSVYQHLNGYLILTLHVGIVIDWATLMKMLPKPWHDLKCMYVIRSYIFESPKKSISTWLTKVHMHNLFWCLNKFDVPTTFHLSFKKKYLFSIQYIHV